MEITEFNSRAWYTEPDDESKFVAPKKTTHCENQWRCAHVPFRVELNNSSNVTLLPFNCIFQIVISNKEFENDFYHLDSDDTYVYTPNYPNGRVAISEFNVTKISTKKLLNYFKDHHVLLLIKKVMSDSFHSKGNSFVCTINNYDKYKLNPETSKLKRIGDPIFNRSTRHSPPISKTLTREMFEKNLSFPAPIGIREEDFAFPSEQNDILIELLNQIFSCKNAPECPEEIKNEIGLNINLNSHNCLWCGEIIDISELNQEYCSKEHSINFCHRNPELGTKKGNVYIGHCSCNREQGGYSEEQRVDQMLRLAEFNPSLKEKMLRRLLS
jgi:hypothetical protein